MYVDPYWFGFAVGVISTVIVFFLLIYMAGCKMNKK
jgi:hypothetical protein